MTEGNSVPAGGLTRWQQIDAARAEALAYYGPLRPKRRGSSAVSARIGGNSTSENPPLTWPKATGSLTPTRRGCQ